MTDKKLIFFDIDGTLYNTSKEVLEDARNAVIQLREQGHIVAIATGRGPFMFKELREMLGIETYISYNGQYIVYEGQVIYENPISNETLDALTKQAYKNDHPIAYCDENDLRVSTREHKHVQSGIGSLKLNFEVTEDQAYYHNNDIHQALLFCTDGEEEAYENNYDDVYFLRWHEFATDVIPKGGSKAKGIEMLIEKMGVDLEQVYAFGDGPNDVEMLSLVKNSVAMGNAVDEAKRVSRYQTRHVDDNGLVEGLKMAGLI